MTNGEKFKEVFKDTIADVGYDGLTNITKVSLFHNQYVLYFLKGWWNAEYKEPTTKNDLGVDAISRSEVLKLMQDNWHTHNGDWAMQESMDDIRALPSVTPQEPKPMVEIDLDYVIKQKYIEREVLDKIRAEIEAKCCITVGRENDGAITLHDVFEIIDKYKGESEENNAV